MTEKKNWTDLAPEAQAAIKATHQRVREAMHHAAKDGGQGHRYHLLAWAFVRGFPYRRVEPRHVQQLVPEISKTAPFEHNLPDGLRLHDLLRSLGIGAGDGELKAWLKLGAPTLADYVPPRGTRKKMRIAAAAEAHPAEVDQDAETVDMHPSVLAGAGTGAE